MNECSFKLSLLTSTVLGLGAYGQHKDINLKLVICPFNINDRFEIDIIMWALGTQSQDGLNLTAGFKRALVYG